MSLIYTEAFAKYGATLNNQQWSVSAFGSDGCLVVSLWQDWIKRGEAKGTLVYRDTLSLWKGNDDGRNEFRRHLNAAKASKAYIKLVVAHPISAGDAALVGNVAEVGPPRASAQGPLNLRANARDHFPKKERT